jgi:hypothetical protein
MEPEVIDIRSAFHAVADAILNPKDDCVYGNYSDPIDVCVEMLRHRKEVIKRAKLVDKSEIDRSLRWVAEPHKPSPRLAGVLKLIKSMVL